MILGTQEKTSTEIGTTTKMVLATQLKNSGLETKTFTC